MTLREIAAEAGVSISTVSRVINQSTNSPYMGNSQTYQLYSKTFKKKYCRT